MDKGKGQMSAGDDASGQPPRREKRRRTADGEGGSTAAAASDPGLAREVAPPPPLLQQLFMGLDENGLIVFRDHPPGHRPNPVPVQPTAMNNQADQLRAPTNFLAAGPPRLNPMPVQPTSINNEATGLQALTNVVVQRTSSRRNDAGYQEALRYYVDYQRTARARQQQQMSEVLAGNVPLDNTAHLGTWAQQQMPGASSSSEPAQPQMAMPPCSCSLCVPQPTGMPTASPLQPQGTNQQGPADEPGHSAIPFQDYLQMRDEMRETARERDQLRAEVTALKNKAAEVDKLGKENARLRKVVGKLAETTWERDQLRAEVMALKGNGAEAVRQEGCASSTQPLEVVARANQLPVQGAAAAGAQPGPAPPGAQPPDDITLMCRVCQVRPATVVLQQCQHRCFCEPCFELYRNLRLKCPSCPNE